jgi:hypothetical protein
MEKQADEAIQRIHGENLLGDVEDNYSGPMVPQDFFVSDINQCLIV